MSITSESENQDQKMSKEFQAWTAAIFAVAMAAVLSQALDLRSLFAVISSVGLGVFIILVSRQHLGIRLFIAVILSLTGFFITNGVRHIDTIFIPYYEIWIVAFLCITAGIRLTRFDWEPTDHRFTASLFALFALTIIVSLFTDFFEPKNIIPRLPGPAVLALGLLEIEVSCIAAVLMGCMALKYARIRLKK